jgi:hypothetical protein
MEHVEDCYPACHAGALMISQDQIGLRRVVDA